MTFLNNQLLNESGVWQPKLKERFKRPEEETQLADIEDIIASCADFSRDVINRGDPELEGDIRDIRDLQPDFYISSSHKDLD